MRSALSVILSSPVPDNKMSHPDYEQTAHDHATILVLLKPVGTQIKPKTVDRLCERIIKCGSRFTVTDSTNNQREILARYVRDYPVENTEWGDFQTHRRLLGLITFGKYENQTELNELCRLHETFKVKYVQTLYDSRTILIGPNASEKLSEPPPGFTTPFNFKTTGFFYGDDLCPDLEAQILEFLKGLFYVLDYKRLDRTREKFDKVALLKAPFEEKDFIGLDLESRNNRKRCVGRAIKHLGDLSLQAGLYSDAFNNYTSAVVTLQGVNDWLWLGAAYEGQCAVSAIMLYPNLFRSPPLQRNSSLQESSPGKQRRDSQASTLPISPTIDTVRTAKFQVLAPEDISKRYRDAIVHYSKYQNAGIIENEASFKASRISIEQNCPLQAAAFLNNMFNSIPMPEKEKIDRFTTLAELYTALGFTRKASFCLRHAALHYVSQKNQNPDWQQCYNLLLQTTSGFKLSLDPAEMSPSNRRGWPSIQIQLLNELETAANRMGNPALATRHLTFLLQTMYNYLSVNQRRDAALQLQAVSQQCEGAPVPLVLDSGIVIPPANLTNIPRTKSFVLKNLQPHLQPQKIERVKEDHGPFLFTPINFGSLDRKTISKSKVDYLWVDGDICEVTMQLVNPLPFELHVSNMRLLTNGVVFESIPESITIPAESGPIAVTLAGTPREAGELEILGFSTHCLGVKSDCQLKHVDSMIHQLYTVEVVPQLPKINVETSLPRTASFSSADNIVTSASISLYGGESAECTITITNVGQVPVEMVDISVQSTLDSLTKSKVFRWSEEDLQTQLPLQPQTSASITLYMHAAMDFVVPTSRHGSTGVYPSQPNSLLSHSGPSSLPSRLSSPSHHTKRQSEITSSFRSATNSSTGSSSGAGSSSRLSKLAAPLHASNVVEGQLRIKYSGAAGFGAGYCRVSSVFIAIEMLPSVQITGWDVLPAELPTQFYLVLDVTNMTNHEMELNYATNKRIYMEGRESCRIPIPVDRCPLNKQTLVNGSGNVDDLQKVCAEHIASLTDLNWQLLGTESKGQANLTGLTLTQNMLDLVRMSPLQWEITINEKVFKSQDELKCTLGDCVSVGVGVSNALENPLKNLTLSVNLYQDHHNGVHNYRLDSRVSIAGANKVMLPTLQESGRAYYECRVVFLTIGQYKFDIQCTSREPSLNPSVTFTELSSNAGHTWRYTPPIEIKVVDDC
ncbi:protein brunelleschi [Trichogramma pretiosum]|uniref:protein brunelleschi n=1 Tax=Trichogramma pretiosum TaxID=7493 RepID=UPI0006C9DE0B|nr:protein brunelleschi [Trichogramma pretiosum]XP_014228053.1 protein brunelleschi [Trichogramma pretiosum]